MKDSVDFLFWSFFFFFLTMDGWIVSGPVYIPTYIHTYFDICNLEGSGTSMRSVAASPTNILLTYYTYIYIYIYTGGTCFAGLEFCSAAGRKGVLCREG